MAFLYPSFLFALFTALIPVIIHLFSFRSHKTVYFSNVQFLKNIRQETKSRSQLKHLLVLIARILAIIALVFAFAQPYQSVFQEVDSEQEEIVAIYIDNSFSMLAESKFGQLLEVSKQKAHAIAKSYRSGSRFLFTTNDYEDKHQRIINRDQVLDFINDTKISPNVRKLSSVINRQKEFLTSEMSKKHKNARFSTFLLSDFQKSSADLSTLNGIADSTFILNLIPLSTQPTNNLYIDSCWFDTPKRKLHQAEIMNVKIVNKSDQDYNDIPVKLTINDTLKALGSFNIDSNTEEIVELTYSNTSTGILNGKIEITDYPIVYDNNFFFSYSIAGNIKILSLRGKNNNQYLKALFAEDEYFSLEVFSEDNIKTSEFSRFNVIVLDEVAILTTGVQQELINFANNGGTILFFPSLEGDITIYNQFLSSLKGNKIIRKDTARTQIKEINYNNDIYQNTFRKIDENVNLPIVFSHFAFEKQIQVNETDILTSENGDKILSELVYGNGRVYVSSISLSHKSSNFASHPLFIPTLYNIALYSQVSGKIFFTIGRDEVIGLKINDIGDKKTIHIKKDKSDFDFIPYHTKRGISSGIRIDMQGNIREEGNYVALIGEEQHSGIAYNYNRNESDLSYYRGDEIADYVDANDNISVISNDNDVSFGNALEEIKLGKQYWKHFLILALLFLAIEIGLIRFMKD